MMFELKLKRFFEGDSNPIIFSLTKRMRHKQAVGSFTGIFKNKLAFGVCGGYTILVFDFNSSIDQRGAIMEIKKAAF